MKYTNEVLCFQHIYIYMRIRAFIAHLYAKATCDPRNEQLAHARANRTERPARRQYRSLSLRHLRSVLPACHGVGQVPRRMNTHGWVCDGENWCLAWTRKVRWEIGRYDRNDRNEWKVWSMECFGAYHVRRRRRRVKKCWEDLKKV